MRLTSEQQTIVEKNTLLVYYVVKTFFNNNDDLIDCGMIGLIKGVCSYDESKGYAISTYLVKCIRNEICLYFRRDSKNPKNTLSLDLEYDDNMTLNSYVASNVNIEEDLINKEIKNKLYKNINKLNLIERFVIVNYYGLYNKKKMLQKEIGNELGLPPNKITKIHLKAIKKLKKWMEDDYDI